VRLQRNLVDLFQRQATQRLENVLLEVPDSGMNPSSISAKV